MTYQTEIDILKKQVERLQQEKEKLEDKYFELLSTQIDSKMQEIKGFTKLVTTVRNNKSKCSSLFDGLCKVINFIFWGCFCLLFLAIAVILGTSSYHYLTKEYLIYQVRPNGNYSCSYSKLIVPSYSVGPYSSYINNKFDCEFNYIKCDSLLDHKYINIKDKYMFQNKSELYTYAVENTKIRNCNKNTYIYVMNNKTKTLKVNAVTVYNSNDDTFYVNNTFTCMSFEPELNTTFVLSSMLDYRIQNDVYNMKLRYLKDKCSN